MTDVAIEHFMQLLTEIDPGVEIISSMTDVYVRHYDKIDITFDKKFVDRYTGIDISDEQILNTLSALGFAPTLENEVFTCARAVLACNEGCHHQGRHHRGDHPCLRLR